MFLVAIVLSTCCGPLVHSTQGADTVRLISSTPAYDPANTGCQIGSFMAGSELQVLSSTNDTYVLVEFTSQDKPIRALCRSSDLRKLSRIVTTATNGTANPTVPLSKITLALTKDCQMELIQLAPEYWVGRYEVTQAQYAAVMESNPSASQDPQQPVESVTYIEVLEFCRRATAIGREAGAIKAGLELRLPTSIEWESFVGNASESDAITSDASIRTSPERVGSMRPNNFGLYDVLGNVSELTVDQSKNSPECHYIRGCCFQTQKQPNGKLKAFIAGVIAKERWNFVGFRCVLAPVSSVKKHK